MAPGALGGTVLGALALGAPGGALGPFAASGGPCGDPTGSGGPLGAPAASCFSGS